ncbi:integrase catalytic region [Burkholderia multivorans]|uniref:ATP-binding protein n=1 Tax=Burkholderia multivorans TaxID=87883 RepID=UPI0019C744B5|nr:ATP-binding protein [Burkholderia multivorans]CAB5283901.1 integrase catalytic region [Burkholderia multivorans]CAB5325288.1 integrase catalytic region [Burkholderia multivorans]CAB5327229.1 integrase catalytic region [Burkholderia multivorans]CAB5330362.1 integrase catalytic region [Burkholderia multivorans]CAB5336952.1 integrase catalytic region [Burkholderia multivorans]
MPAHRMSMRKLKEVLRLKWACGLSHRQISRAIGISVGAISAYAARASAAGLDWATVEPLADAILDRLVHQAHKLPLKGESMRKTNAKQSSAS